MVSSLYTSSGDRGKKKAMKYGRDSVLVEPHGSRTGEPTNGHTQPGPTLHMTVGYMQSRV